MEPTYRRLEESFLARFVVRGVAESFLTDIARWNEAQGLPDVVAVLMKDGRQVEIRTTAKRRQGVERLIASYGGRIVDDPHTNGSHRTGFAA
jgi:hypothetical protein